MASPSSPGGKIRLDFDSKPQPLSSLKSRDNVGAKIEACRVYGSIPLKGLHLLHQEMRRVPALCSKDKRGLIERTRATGVRVTM